MKFISIRFNCYKNSSCSYDIKITVLNALMNLKKNRSEIMFEYLYIENIYLGKTLEFTHF